MLLFYMSFIDNDEDKTRFELLYNQYKQIMKTTAMFYLKNEYDSEDAVHEAFMRIAKHMNGVGEIPSHKTQAFVVKIVKNICLDMIKAEKRHENVSFDEELDNSHYSFDNFKYELQKIEMSVVYEKIKALPDIYKDVMIYKFTHEYTDREIADLCGISYATVRKRVERARELLSFALKDWRE